MLAMALLGVTCREEEINCPGHQEATGGIQAAKNSSDGSELRSNGAGRTRSWTDARMNHDGRPSGPISTMFGI